MVAAKTQAAQGVLPGDIEEARVALSAVLDDIRRHIVGNDYLIEVTGVALVAGANMFMHGLPGISKTMLAKLLAARLQGKFYRKLYGAYTEPNHIFGGEDFAELQKGRYVRVRQGTILDCNIHFADEIFEASDAIKTELLGIFDETPTYDEGGKTEYLEDLLLIMSASNRLPGKQDAAIGDRLVFQVPVSKPAEREDRKEILRRHIAEKTGELPTQPQAHVSVDQVKSLRAYARANVSVPEGILEKLVSLDDKMQDEIGVYVSPRTLNRCIDILRASALLAGRDTVSPKDLVVLQYVVAPIPSQPQAKEVILDLVAPLEKEAEMIGRALAKEAGDWIGLSNSSSKNIRSQAKKSGQDVMNSVMERIAQLEVLAQRAEKEGYDHDEIAKMIRQAEVLSQTISKRIRELYREPA